MLKAITFDVDNTLIDFIKMKTRASNDAAIAMIKTGLKMDKEKAKKELFETYIKDIDGNTAFEIFLRNNNAYSDRVLAAALNAYLRTKLDFLEPYPEVKETLLKLKKKGLKLGIVTDAPRLKAYQRLDAMKIADLFDVVVGKEDTGEEKPSKMPFLAALKQLKLKPEEVMHVGDWPEKDIKGAKLVGMKTCFAKYGFQELGRMVKADFEIDRFEEVLNII